MKNDKPNIFLDLDQTIISAEPTEEYDYVKYKQKSKKFTYIDMDGYYIVFERPYLQDFLDYIFKEFTVSIWTAASKDYALFIIDNIVIGDKKDRKLDWIFFSYHCSISKSLTNNSKDLKTIWNIFKIQNYTSDNTLILDDNIDVYDSQKNKCILAIPFEFTKEGSEEDNFLKELKPLLEKHKLNELSIVDINKEIDYD